MYITFLVKQVYWYISQVSGERLQDHWSSGLVYFSRLDSTSPCIHYPVESCKISVVLFGSMLSNLKGTDETLIVETAVWPISFLINVFTVLKGSQFLFIFMSLQAKQSEP